MDEYNVVQVNGQRKYGPPVGWKGDPPGRGTEVFVSNIPRDCKEDEIVPLFSKVGKIYMVRLMMDFSGTNRGFCFVQYGTPSDANLAIQKLDGAEIRPSHPVKVVLSVDNRRLFVGHIPKSKTKWEIFEALSSVVDGLEDIILYLSPSDKKVNRGFCFAEFDSHRSAAMARRVLVSQGLRLWDQDIRVDWAVPEAYIDDHIMSAVTVIYVRNLLLKTSERAIHSAVLNFVNEKEITRLRKVRDFAFIHFRTRDAAERALKGLNGCYIDDVEVFATWARPSKIVKKFEYHSNDVKVSHLTPSTKKQDLTFSTSASSDNARLDLEMNQQNAIVPARSYPPYFNYRKDCFQQFSPFSPVNNSLYTFNEHLKSPDVFWINLQHAVSSYLLSARPSIALQGIASLLEWGMVTYDISVKGPEYGFTHVNFIAVVLLTKENRTIAYTDVHHRPALTVEQAKDLVAENFLNIYLHYWRV